MRWAAPTHSQSHHYQVKISGYFADISSGWNIFFSQQGIVNYQLGIILGTTMFIGGIIGGRLTLKLSNVWLQRIYLAVLAILAFISWRKSQAQNQPASTIDLLTPLA